MVYRQELGQYGEGLAREYLGQKGFKILTQNYHTRWGELDLVAQKAGEVIFIEVKTRRQGWPEEAVDNFKLARLYKAIYEYLWHFEIRKPWKLVVLAIILGEFGEVKEIKWVEAD